MILHKDLPHSASAGKSLNRMAARAEDLRVVINARKRPSLTAEQRQRKAARVLQVRPNPDHLLRLAARSHLSWWDMPEPPMLHSALSFTGERAASDVLERYLRSLLSRRHMQAFVGPRLYISRVRIQARMDHWHDNTRTSLTGGMTRA